MHNHFVHTAEELQNALALAGDGDTIHMAAGSYRLKATIRTPNLTLIGEGAEQTEIVWDDYAQ